MLFSADVWINNAFDRMRRVWKSSWRQKWKGWTDTYLHWFRIQKTHWLKQTRNPLQTKSWRKWHTEHGRCILQHLIWDTYIHVSSVRAESLNVPLAHQSVTILSCHSEWPHAWVCSLSRGGNVEYGGYKIILPFWWRMPVFVINHKPCPWLGSLPDEQ